MDIYGFITYFSIYFPYMFLHYIFTGLLIMMMDWPLATDRETERCLLSHDELVITNCW